MSKKDDALKLALDALMEATKIHASSCKCSICRAVIVAQDALASEASEQPRGEATLAQQQEPVAWVGSLKDPQPHCVTNLKYCSSAQWDTGYHLKYIPLYTSPQPSKPWVGLSNDEIYDMYNEPRSDAEMVEFARAIEAKLKEKNGF